MHKRTRLIFIRFFFFVIMAQCGVLLAGDKPTPPAQPASGPGGADYAYAAVSEKSYGEGDLQYWIFTPDQPKPAQAPVIIFTHGWGGMEPKSYITWIHHLARKGNIVIYPRYQATLKTPAKDFTANAIAAIKAAIGTLQQGDVKPQLDLVATVGHSAGGVLAANLAVEMPANGLPTPKAVFSAEPGITVSKDGRPMVPLSNMSKMSATTLLVVLVGDSDRLVKDTDGLRIYNETTAIPAAQKNLLTLISDDHGEPALVANHLAPCAPEAGATNSIDINAMTELLSSPSSEDESPMRKRFRERLAKRLAEQQTGGEKDTNDRLAKFQAQSTTNALDYFATWKITDALTNAAFYNKNRDVALGGGAAQTNMGNWSDGTPVEPMQVTK